MSTDKASPPLASAQEAAPWSGWACQYPGKLPRLYGAREIADLNLDAENGDQLLFLSAITSESATQVKGVEDAATELSKHSRTDFIRGAQWAAKSEHEVIAAFLERTGQYVTNDASREAALQQACADTDLQYREALHCLSSVMRAASHALVSMAPSEKEAKLRSVLAKAHDWYMAEVNSDTYMGAPAIVGTPSKEGAAEWEETDTGCARVISRKTAKEGAGLLEQARIALGLMLSYHGQGREDYADVAQVKAQEAYDAIEAASLSHPQEAKPFAEVVQTNQGRYFTSLAAVGVDAPAIGTKLFARPVSAPAIVGACDCGTDDSFAGEIIGTPSKEGAAQVEADAARYRWLRAQHESQEELSYDAEGLPIPVGPTALAFTVFMPVDGSLDPVGCMPGELDAAIDAAIQSQGAKP